MKMKFFIGWDDQQKLIPILENFGSLPFTKSVVVKEKIVPELTSGDITRWGGNDYIKRVCISGERGSSNSWRLTDKTIFALNKAMKKGM